MMAASPKALTGRAMAMFSISVLGSGLERGRYRKIDFGAVAAVIQTL